MFPTCDRSNTSQASYFSRFAVTGWGIKFHLFQKHAGAPVGPPAARVNLAGKWSRTTVLASLWPLYAGEIRGDGDRLAGPGLAEGAIEGCYVVFLAATLLSSRSMALVTAVGPVGGRCWGLSVVGGPDPLGGPSSLTPSSSAALRSSLFCH